MTTKADLANMILRLLNQGVTDENREAAANLINLTNGSNQLFIDVDFEDDSFNFEKYAESARVTATHDDNEMVKSLDTISILLSPALKTQVDKTILFLKFFYLVSGLASEAGEVADKIKKVYRNQGGNFATPFEKDGNEKLITEHDIILELGDVLWYLSSIADLLDSNGLELVAKVNNKKLLDRQRRNVIKDSGDSR